MNQTVASTSRLSYTYPNLTNVPVRNELGKKIRTLYVPPEEGWWVWAIDQSQIELRWAAHLSQDPWMLEVLGDLERSIHGETCKEVYGIEEDDEEWELKYKHSKNGNFARLYGAGPPKIAETLEVTLGEAEMFFKAHKALMPGFDAWTEVQYRRVRNRGYAETFFGFRRLIPQIRSMDRAMRSEGERLAVNMPIQGSAAGHIQYAMVRIQEFLEDKESYMAWQVHDELVGFSPEGEVDEVVKGVGKILSGCINISVPTPVDIEVSRVSWGEVESYEEVF